MKFFKIFIFLFLFLGCNIEKSNYSNVIIIMSDDLGYGGIGSYGNKQILTPNLDFLANNGIKFNDFHSNGTVCTPTRSSLITGLYPQKTGLEGVIYAKGETRNYGLDPKFTTLADVFKENNYKTAIIGKWHLGYDPKFNPTNFGFDQFYGYVSGNIDFHTHRDGAGYHDWYHNKKKVIENGYSTDLITKHSANFINQNKNKPFFLFVSHEAPHVPFQGRNDPGFRFSPEDSDYYGPVKDKVRAYKEMVEVMDEGIGVIINTLKKNQLLEKTLIFFMSDNGAREFGHNGELRGEKGSLFEGGIRVPAIAFWKSVIESKVSNELLITFDLFPTLISILNLKNYQKTLDGLDFSKILFSNEKLIKDRKLFWRYRGDKVFRNKKYKLLLTDNDTLLFDMENDISEKNNLKHEKKYLIDNYIKEIIDWETEMYNYPVITNGYP